MLFFEILIQKKSGSDEPFAAGNRGKEMKTFYFYTYKNESEKLAGEFETLEEALLAACRYVLSERESRNDYNNALFEIAIDRRGEITVRNMNCPNFLIKAYDDV